MRRRSAQRASSAGRSPCRRSSRRSSSARRSAPSPRAASRSRAPGRRSRRGSIPPPLRRRARRLVTGTHLAAVYMAGDAAHLGLDDLRAASAPRRSSPAPWPARWRSAGSPSCTRTLRRSPRPHDRRRPRVRRRLGRRGRRGARPRGRRPLRRGALQRRGRRRRDHDRLGRRPASGAASRPDDGAQAAAPHATLVALLASVAVGLAIIGPCLVALYRMALTGDVGERYQPLGTACAGAAAPSGAGAAMSRRAQSALVAVCFLAGVVLMICFDAAVTRAPRCRVPVRLRRRRPVPDRRPRAARGRGPVRAPTVDRTTWCLPLLRSAGQGKRCRRS